MKKTLLVAFLDAQEREELAKTIFRYFWNTTRYNTAIYSLT